jgi:MFS family permease
LDNKGGFGWTVLVAVTWSYGLVISAMTNYNLIYPKLINFYNQTDNNVFYSAWIGSSSLGVGFLVSAPASILIDLIGSRYTGLAGSLLASAGFISSAFCLGLSMQLQFLTYSLLTGIGTGLTIVSSLSILPHYFDKKLGLANGICNAGGAIIVISTALGMGYMLENFSLKTTYLVMGGVFFSTFFSSLFFQSQIQRDKTKSLKIRVKESLGLDIFKKKKFLLWTVTGIFGGYGNSIPVLTMGHYCTLFYPDFKPEILNIIYGISSGLSSIVFGKLMDKYKFSAAYNYIATYFVFGICTVFLPISKNFFVFCSLIAVISIFDGLYLCSLCPWLFKQLSQVY